ncbi:flagellar P-ring protein precursor FlgI [Crenobacter luteus]|uniref:Flagellar P-ring protein n=1 Tax=Crenobacter luteus TaxID=1452487 RepID=A0A163DSX7_9NEIS|nr:flagellar basal body P-ring protein FlgI [Crenobacter luteus]KZE35261.1 flagellar biosynthesis protein FlgI [Crenobacter luteus]TCP13819.1 flagellar P-ring protein precursor FlgI [Crenobacter luteus]
MKRLWLWLVLAALALPAHANQRIKELATVGGVRSNQLLGYGLVVGLDGSGDKRSSSPFTAQSMASMLTQLGVQLPPGTKIDSKNTAAVTITASLPPFARRGQAIDVTVSSIGDAKSLRGGTLLMAPLKGADGQIYAMAQGNVVVGGAGASAGGNSAQINQLSVGRIPAGATVEREVPTALGGNDAIQLELLEADFTTANRVVEAINRQFGAGTAQAVDGRLIEVRAPYDGNQRVQFLSRLENLVVKPAETLPLVIVNARTGSVVMNRAVTLDAVAVSHGNLSVTVGNNDRAGNPDINIRTDRGEVVNLPKSANLAQVVNALNAVGATPQDLVSILQAIKAAGALRAELQII